MLVEPHIRRSLSVDTNFGKSGVPEFDPIEVVLVALFTLRLLNGHEIRTDDTMKLCCNRCNSPHDYLSVSLHADLSASYHILLFLYLLPLLAQAYHVR